MFQGYQAEMQLFAERTAFRNRKATVPFLPPDQDVALGLDTTRVMYAAYLSAERAGAAVNFPDPGESLS